MREILTRWKTVAGTGFVTVMYFDDLTPVANQRSALQAFYTGIVGHLTTGTEWTIATEGRLMNHGTGGLLGSWSETVTRAGSGAVSSAGTADAVQALVRWNTGQVVGGRFLKGRTFIPGIPASSIAGGNLAPAAQSSMTSAASGLITSAVGFGVWHRPTGGAGGVLEHATSASVWPELAVLRRRRK